MGACTISPNEFDACASLVTKHLRPLIEQPAYLDKIMAHVAVFRGLELQCFPPVSAFDTFIRQMVAQWKQPATDCREAVVDALRRAVRTMVEHIFSKNPALSTRKVGVAEEQVDQVNIQCAKVLDRLLVGAGGV